LPTLAQALHVSPERLREPLEGLTGRAYVATDVDRGLALTESGLTAGGRDAGLISRSEA
jgi:Mn-dependent DtxR family transcriptional regulator